MILRERFGMNYQQAMHDEPAWYVDMLLEHHRAQQQALISAEQRAAAEAAELERTEQQFLQDMKAAGLEP